MDLKQIQYFIALFEDGSVTRDLDLGHAATITRPQVEEAI